MMDLLLSLAIVSHVAQDQVLKCLYLMLITGNDILICELKVVEVPPIFRPEIVISRAFLMM